VTMGSRRAYNEWIDEYATPRGRRWVKRHTVRLDRLEAQEEIREQLEDRNYGIDPD
jgi:thiaminase